MKPAVSVGTGATGFRFWQVASYGINGKVYPVRQRIVSRVLFLVILVFSLFMFPGVTAYAQSPAEYFELGYASANLSQSEVNGAEAFSVSIGGKITCVKDLPLAVSEASLTSRIVAESLAGGAQIVLNRGYTWLIKPFPAKAGEAAEMREVVSLQFPPGTPTGDYQVSAQISEGKVKALFWMDVTEFLPQKQLLGQVKFTAAPAPASTPTPVSQTPVSAPEAKPAAPAASPELAPLVVQTREIVPGWVWLVVAAAVTTTIINIAMIARYCKAKVR